MSHVKDAGVADNGRRPVFWVSRLAIFKSLQDAKPVRDVKLSLGMNIIWAKEGTSGRPAAASGHDAGKTTFCRLLRYCLGEHTFGTEAAQKLIRKAFASGYVAAEVQLLGKQWAVARPIGGAKLSYAKEGVSIEDLLKDKPSWESYHEFRRQLEDAILRGLPVAKIPGTEQLITFEHILAWCSRDQQARFQEIWQWRSSRSDSGTKAFDRPKVDALQCMRVVLGLLIRGEADLVTSLADRDRDLAAVEARIANRGQEIDYWRKKLARDLAEALKVDLPADGSATTTGLYSTDWGSLVTESTAHLDRREQDLSQQVEKLDIDLADVRAELKRADAQLRYLRALAKFAEKHNAELPGAAAELQKAREELEALAAQQCEFGLVTFGQCMHVQKRLSVIKMNDITDGRYFEHEEAKGEEYLAERQARLQNQEQHCSELEQRQKWILGERRRLDNERTQISNRRGNLAKLLSDLNGWVALAEKMVADDALADLHKDRLRLQQERDVIKERLNRLLQDHDDKRKRLEHVFNTAVRKVLSDEYGGEVGLDDGQMSFVIKHVASLSGEAMETLAVLLGDISCLIFASGGDCNLPGFLIHDSPREADLGLSIYRSFLQYVAGLEKTAKSPEAIPFQYIVTTTTAPPADLRRGGYVKLPLDASKDELLLFCENVAKAGAAAEPGLF